MGVRSDNDLSRCSPAFLDSNLMTDPFVDIVIMDILFRGELPHIDVVVCCLNRVGRDLVVKEHNDTLWIEDVYSAHLVELLDGERAGDIVDHGAVKGCHDHFARPYIATTFPREYLLHDCRCHALVASTIGGAG